MPERVSEGKPEATFRQKIVQTPGATAANGPSGKTLRPCREKLRKEAPAKFFRMKSARRKAANKIVDHFPRLLLDLASQESQFESL
jgi:hypothetical protein